MKSPGFKDLSLGGVLLALLCLISYEILPEVEAVMYSYVLWVVALVYGLLLLNRGFNYYRIKYSFSLTFIAVVIALYEIIVLLTGATELLQAIAIGLTPYLSVALFGSLRERIQATKERIKIMKTPVPLLRRIKATLYQLDTTLWSFMIFGFAYLMVFMLVPILLVLLQSFTPPTGGEWWMNFYNVLRTSSYVRFKPLVTQPYSIVNLPGGECIIVLRGIDYGPVLNSLIVASVVTAVATVLGVFIAYVLARYRFPGHTLTRILAIVPLFNTPFVNAYVVKLLWSEGGPVSILLRPVLGCALKIDSLLGVMITQIMSFYPIVYLNAYTAFINVDPSTEEQAENLGAKGFRIFRTVTLPLALPGIVAGSTLVFVFSLEDLGAPIVFNEKRLMSYRIYDGLITAHGVISPEIAALGVVLLLAALIAFLAIRNYVSMRSYAMISRGGRWNPRIKKPGISGSLLIYLVVVPLILFAMLPQIGVILMSLDILKPYVRGGNLVIELSSDPLKYIKKALSDPAIYRYIINTLTYAGISVVIAVFLAVCVGYSVNRLKVKYVPSILDSLATAPLAIPGLVFALGYYVMFTRFAELLPRDMAVRFSPASVAFEAWIIFILAFSVRRLPYVVRSVFAGFQQVHGSLEETAMNLGASRYKVIFGVIMPFIIGYVLSGALIGFIYMATEVTTSITFGGIREDQAPLTFYMKQQFIGGAGEGPYLAAAMGTLLILIQLIVVVIVVYIFKQRYAFVGV
ncbi:MAG: iron ABC transporter permease [Desulfurococcaceae archaeon]